MCFESQVFDLHIGNVIIRQLASYADIRLVNNPRKPASFSLFASCSSYNDYNISQDWARSPIIANSGLA